MKAKYTWMISDICPKRKLLYLKLWKCFLKWRKCTGFFFWGGGGLWLDLRKTLAETHWQKDKYITIHNLLFLLLPQPIQVCWDLLYISKREKNFLQQKKAKVVENSKKVLLARDVKGGNCIDLSSASLGICPPPSFLSFLKWGRLFHSRRLWIQSSMMFSCLSLNPQSDDGWTWVATSTINFSTIRFLIVKELEVTYNGCFYS